MPLKLRFLLSCGVPASCGGAAAYAASIVCGTREVPSAGEWMASLCLYSPCCIGIQAGVAGQRVAQWQEEVCSGCCSVILRLVVSVFIVGISLSVCCC